jgi:hypothetical protein
MATFRGYTFQTREILGNGGTNVEPFVDIVLLVTACSFTLFVGIIIGFYVEGFFRMQKIVKLSAAAVPITPAASSLSSVHRSKDESYLLHTLPSKVLLELFF